MVDERKATEHEQISECTVCLCGQDISEGILMRLRNKEKYGLVTSDKVTNVLFSYKFESLYICIDHPKIEPVSSNFPQGYFSITKMSF